jgi:hypothetical protein
MHSESTDFRYGEAVLSWVARLFTKNAISNLLPMRTEIDVGKHLGLSLVRAPKD